MLSQTVSSSADGAERRFCGAGAATRLLAALLWLVLLWTSLGPLCAVAQPTPATPELRSNDDWRAWREALLELRYRDAQGALGQLRAQYEGARARGDRHAEWMHLAWLARETAAVDYATSAPLLTLAEQAIETARQGGDTMAAFELLWMVEATRVGQQYELPRESLLSQAAAMAGKLGDPLREGLVWQLRGLAAAQAGQDGEALFQYQRAMPLLSGRFDRAELLFAMAQALFENPTVPAARQALGYLRELDEALPPERYPSFVEALVRQSELLSRLDRNSDAVAAAQRAASVARRFGLATPLAQAQVALGHAYLGAGSPALALATFKSASMDALNVAGRLSCLVGWGLAQAQLGDPGAMGLLERGHALAQAQSNTNSLAIAQFYEASSRVRQTLGDATGALDDLARAGAIRSAMANTAREKLLQARVDGAARAAEAQVEAAHRRWLVIGVLGLAAAVLLAGGFYAHQFRQRRQIARLVTQLQSANAQLEQFNAARSRHLAAACHDLRQPAHVLGLLTESQPAEPQRPEDVEAHVQAVQRCSRTLTDMLDALMDMTQLERGTYVPHAEIVDLGELLVEVDLQYRQAAQAKGLGWQVSAVSALVSSDRHLLRRILFNLASNAVRYSTHGGVQIHAAVTEQRVLVEIADTGPGIPVDKLTGDATDPEFGVSLGGAVGLGMGLSIVRQACRVLGHEISVPLSSPRGSVVRLGMERLDADHAGGMLHAAEARVI
ncbi:HAMP domain-containing sensor histidine kinase [Roseateles sp.]|uniref:sensor histidine kinase n=1 Tax=Roseateles sp. TaxID=1971397 RepID=UPI002DFC3ABD|nr:HAMP domain-containing sensor histidine kinase [Roseateles sp.]